MNLGYEKEIVINENAFVVSVTDLRGKFIFANDEFCRLSEFSKEELVGMHCNVLRHPDMPNHVFDDLWSTIKNGKAWSGYMKNKTKNGNYYWALANVYPFKSNSGEQCFMSCRRHPSSLIKNEDKKLQYLRG